MRFVFLLFLLFLSAAQAQEMEANPPAQIEKESTDEPEENEPSVEEIVRMRDPFRRLVEIEVAKDEPATELQRYPTEQFKMVGVITGPKEVKAMVTAPDGKNYFVSKNTPIGVRNGRVWQITARRIVVRETVKNLLGKNEVITTELTLPEEGSLAILSSEGGSPVHQESENGPLEKETQQVPVNQEGEL